jgi:hypothetical protein
MRRSFIRAATAALAMLAAGFILTPAPADAQQGQRLHGVVTRVDGDKLILRGDNGQPITVLLAPDARVTAIVPAKLSDIKPGRFVGTAARPEANDRWRAIEVHIFPAGSRLGEGHRPWDPEPGATMTNADVTASVVKAGKAELTLATGGKNYTIDVPPGTPIVAMNPGTRGLVKKGATVSIRRAMPSAGGAFTADDITVITARNYPIR